MRQAITGEDKLQAEADNMNNGKTIIYEIIEQLERLSEQKQKQILEYVKAMLQEAPQGTPGRELLRFAGAIPTEEIEQIRQAIDQDCERINPNEW
jgi:hypothetical protein